MITLYGAGEGFGLPEVSPYVTKTEVQLKMAGLGYAKAKAGPQDAPKGQIPFIEHAGERIGDSTFIRLHLEDAFGLDFDEGLDTRQRAEAWMTERMLENHLCWAVTYFRWLVPENFAKGPAHFFDDVPEAMRETLKADVLERVEHAMRANGVARHSEPEIVAVALKSLSALSQILGDKDYLMGARPCGADATAFAVLAALYTPHFPCQLRTAALRFTNLVAYCDRLMALFYPDFAWAPLAPKRQPVAA
jgi:glutathione S-transferase